MTGQTMVYEVQLGDGRVVEIEGPEGATDEQLQAALGSGAQQGNAFDAQGNPVDDTYEGEVYDRDGKMLYMQESVSGPQRPPIGDVLTESAQALGGNAIRAVTGIPDMLAAGGEAITNGIGSALGAGIDAFLRANGADQDTLDEWQQIMAPRHIAGVGERLDAAGVPHAATPSMDFAQQMAFGAALPVPGMGGSARGPSFPAATARAAGSPAAEAVAAGQKFGIDIPMGATGRGASMVEKGFDNLPFSASVTQASRNRLGDQVGAAVEDVASTYGPTTSFSGIGETAQAGAKNWIDRFQTVAGKAYDAIPIKPETNGRLSNTVSALEGLTQKFSSNPQLAAIMNNPKFSRFLGALRGTTEDVATGLLDESGAPITRQVQNGGKLSWQDLKAFRSDIGEQIGDNLFSDGTAKSQLRGLYGALSEDMKATAAAQGPGALRAFERANNLWKQGQERIDGAITKLLGNDSSKTAESAAAKIQAIARDGKSSADLATLAEIRKSLRPDEWAQVQNGVIRLLGQPVNSAGREFNPQTFVQTFKDMAPEARNLFFGSGELRKNLDEFAGVMDTLARNNALRNTSNSAPGLTGAGTVGTIASALLNPILGIKMAGLGGTTYGLARLWTNPRFVQWASGYSKMLNGAAKAGAQPTPAKFSTHLRLLNSLASTEPALADDIVGLQQRLQQAFSAAPNRAAAEQEDPQ